MAETYLSDIQIAARYGVHRTTPWRWLDLPKVRCFTAAEYEAIVNEASEDAKQ